MVKNLRSSDNIANRNDKSFYCIVYIICWMLIPNMAISIWLRLLALVCATYWITRNILIKRKLYFTRSIFIGIAYIFLIFLIHLLSGKSLFQFLYNHLWLFISIFFSIVGKYYYVVNKIILFIIFKITIYISGFISIFTIIGCIRNPAAARYGGADYAIEVQQYALKHFIGGFGFIYFCVLFSCLLLCILISKNKLPKHDKRIITFSMILQMTAVIFSGYIIAMMALTIGIVSAFLLKKISIIKVMVLMLFVLLVMIYFSSALEIILKVLLEWVKNIPLYYEKVSDSYNALYGNKFSGYNTFNNRWLVYQKSIVAIFKNPFIGNMVFNEQNLGNHSAILDNIGYYGLFIFLMYFYFYFITPFKITNKRSYSVEKPVFIIVLLIICILNPMPAFESIVIFLLYPAVSDIISS